MCLRFLVLKPKYIFKKNKSYHRIKERFGKIINDVLKYKKKIKTCVFFQKNAKLLIEMTLSVSFIYKKQLKYHSSLKLSIKYMPRFLMKMILNTYVQNKPV